MYTGNKSPFNKGHMDYYREYMTKNTIAFEKGRTNSDGNDEWEPMYLFPKGYPYEKARNS